MPAGYAENFRKTHRNSSDVVIFLANFLTFFVFPMSRAKYFKTTI